MVLLQIGGFMDKVRNAIAILYRDGQKYIALATRDGQLVINLTDSPIKIDGLDQELTIFPSGHIAFLSNDKNVIGLPSSRSNVYFIVKEEVFKLSKRSDLLLPKHIIVIDITKWGVKLHFKRKIYTKSKP